MDKPFLKLTRKVYFALMYEGQDYFAALDRESGHPYRVDDISLAWLRREPTEFEDFCRMFPELRVVKVTFMLEPHGEE